MANSDPLIHFFWTGFLKLETSCNGRSFGMISDNWNNCSGFLAIDQWIKMKEKSFSSKSIVLYYISSEKELQKGNKKFYKDKKKL